jgi:hypothetical protein
MRAAEQGWYSDPWEHHEARWFSSGDPTALVRDGYTEGHDPPPDSPYASTPEPLAEPRWLDSDDACRADDRDDDWHFDNERAQSAVWAEFGRSWGRL